MKLTTFSYQGRVYLGEVADDRVYALASPDHSMTSMIRRGVTPSRTYQYFAASDVRFHAPLIPGKIIAIGKNYAEHAAETQSDVPDKPLIFAKFPSSVIGTGDPITWRTSVTSEVDYEGELAVVIGRRARDVSEDDALDYVLGYTAANDVSARDLQLRIDNQWTRAKSLDTFCPLGPYIVTKNEIDDPQKLRITTTVNGETRQDSNTSNMVFSVKHLIAYCSRMFTLEPGDVILTGTPSGVGLGMTPPAFLKDGDAVTVSIENIGEITNPCRALEE